MPDGLQRAEAAIPVAAVHGDQRRRTQRLDVVHDRRLLLVAVRDRIGRAIARHATLALERLDQGGFLAADVRARADVDADVEVEAGLAADAGAEQVRLAPSLERRLELLEQVAVLAAQVQEPAARADRIGGDRHAVEQQVRVAGEQHAVLERAGLTLVGVADDVALESRRVPAGLPLDARGEAGAAAAAQVRTLHLLERRDRALCCADVGLAPGPLVRRALAPSLRSALQCRPDGVPGLEPVGEHDVRAAHVVLHDEELRRPVRDRHPRQDQVADARDALVGQGRDRDAVDQQRRALVAEAGARGSPDAHEAVLGNLAGFDPEPVAERLHQALVAGHAVGDVVGEQDAIAAARLEGP